MRRMKTHWLRFCQDGTQEIYFRVPSKTTPTTILVAVIKVYRNRKTNLNAKTNPNSDLQKTCKKKLKEKRKKIIARTAGFEPMTLDSIW